MSSIMDYFTPVTGLIGGCVIGLSAAVLLLWNGDILGASGIASSFVVQPKKTFLDQSQLWKLFFVGAFFLTSRVYVTIWPDALNDERLGSDGIPFVSGAGYLVGGFLVGIGTRLGNGCTTGHGICGMARVSIRSIAAVASFMLSGILTATIGNMSGPIFQHLHLNGDEIDASVYLPTKTSDIISSIIGSLIVVAAILRFFLTRSQESTADAEKIELENNRRKLLPAVASAFLFSIGLVISQMTLFSKIYGFLNMRLIPKGTWDPTLLMVMGGGFTVSCLSYQWVKHFSLFQNSRALECPLSQHAECGKFNVPTNKAIDANLICGGVLFGLGWGTAGWCPGPALFLAFAGYPYLIYRWWPMFMVGAFLGEQIKSLQNKLKECRTSPADTNEPQQTKSDLGDDTGCVNDGSSSTLCVDHSARQEESVELETNVA